MISIVKTGEIGEESFGAVKVRNLFSDKQMNLLSVAKIRVEGVNRKHKNLKSDEFHYVLDGKGDYEVNGKRSDVELGDLIHIPKGDIYENSGQMNLLVFSSPSYDASEIEYED
jgi:mannose-6-phosphate isomerase-like protein (cupin superfamily)